MLYDYFKFLLFYSNYTDIFNPSDVFSSLDIHYIDNVQQLDVNNRYLYSCNFVTLYFIEFDFYMS